MISSLIKLNPEVKTAWLAALRSGEYQQGRINLHRKSEGDAPAQFCCLGVLCDVAAKNKVEMAVDQNNTVVRYDNHNAALPQSVIDWAFELPAPMDSNRYGNEEIFGRFASSRTDDLAQKVGGKVDLTEMNDSGEFSFAQIADFIEEHL